MSIRAIPHPDDVDACDGDQVPAAVTAKLAKAKTILGHSAGKKSRRVAAKLFDRAAKRVGKAVKHGDLSPGCAAALGDELDGGSTCAACSGE